MSLNKYILLALVALSFWSATQAQDAIVVFQSEQAFRLSINKKPQFDDFKTSIKIRGLKSQLPYSAQLTFKNDSVLNQKFYLINDGFIHYYSVNEKSLSFKKAVPSIGSNDKTPSIDFIKGIVVAVKDSIKDTVTTDTNYVVPFKDYYKLDNYTGRIGCPFPLKDEELNTIIDAIKAEDLEDLKLEKAKVFIQEMDSACVLIAQTKNIIELFEYEETKLVFAKFMYIYTFDIDNYFELYEVFNFENSKEVLKNYVGMQIDKSTKTKNK